MSRLPLPALSRLAAIRSSVVFRRFKRRSIIRAAFSSLSTASRIPLFIFAEFLIAGIRVWLHAGSAGARPVPVWLFSGPQGLGRFGEISIL